MLSDSQGIQDPFNEIILPLSKQYVEVSWFADEKVSATKETSSATQNLGWTCRLSQIKDSKDQPLIQPPKTGGKYIELERMLSSIVFLHFFWDGSKPSYEKLTSIQKPDERLKWESYLAIHQLTRKVANTEELFQALKAMLIFSDAGKTPVAIKRAENDGLRQADHDDFIEALFHQKIEIIGEILPNFRSLSANAQDILIQVTSAMPIHLGHVLHLEGGSQMFANFEQAFQRGKVNKELLDFAFLIQLCDVAASAAHINNEGSLALTENTYQGYQLVKRTLEFMLERKNQTEALYYYLGLRGEHIGAADTADPKTQFLVRMACWMRLYTKEDYLLLKTAVDKLPQEALQIALEQFHLKRGVNTWKRNPTYGPAVLINLANFANLSEERQVKITRALEGACCLALWCKAYDEKVRDATNPVNFNAIAGLAAKFPEKFQLQNFNIDEFKLNEKKLVSFESKELAIPNVENSTSTQILTWSKGAETKKVDKALEDLIIRTPESSKKMFGT